MMDMFKGMLGSLGEAEGSNPTGEGMPSDEKMKKIMEEFTSFLSDGGDQNPEF